MGGCVSCMRVILETEPDIKINVIEPTTVIQPETVTTPVTPTAPSAPRLTVPSAHGTRLKVSAEQET